MTKKMLINATHPEENRVAIVDDGILSELDIEIAGREQTRGNVYKAVVVRVETGLQAAFVDYGAERLGFLQIGEIHPSFFKAAESSQENRSRPRINDLLRRGQEILVQVVKEERGTKGAALTTYLSLPGRYMVLMPDSDTKGISRKIEEEAQRKKLKEIMNSLDLSKENGYIVRTAGIGQKKEELKRDYNYLLRVLEKIQTIEKQVRAPALIYKESNLVIRSIRDYFSSDMEEVLVDDPKVFQEAVDFFQVVMPEYARLVKLHQERRPIFSRYQIEEQIETITKNKVTLTSGGSIVIDSTEALVAIDVNSGKMSSEQNVEATAYKTNLEAAEEVARQLRLRDLGGLIIIDFIDMRDRKHIREVEKRLKDALKADKARVTVGKISQFGLLEMSRQRIKATLAEGAFRICPHCEGTGRIKSPEAQAIAFLRNVYASMARGQYGRIEGEVPLEVATYLLNMKREELLEIERQHNLFLSIKGRPDLIAGQSEITFHKREEEPAKAAEPVEAHPSVPVQSPEALAAVDSESGDETTKKKRKRRRKKKEPIATEEPQPATEAAPEEIPPQAAPAPEENQGEEQHQETTGASPGEEVKKRRRRRRRKKPAASEEAISASSASTETAPGHSVVEPSSPAPVSPQNQERIETSSALERKPSRTDDEKAPEPVSTSALPDETKAMNRPARRPQREVIFTFDFSLEEDQRSGEATVSSEPKESEAAGAMGNSLPEAGEGESDKTAAPGRRRRPSRSAGSRRQGTVQKSENQEGNNSGQDESKISEALPDPSNAAVNAVSKPQGEKRKSGSRGGARGRKSTPKGVPAETSNKATRENSRETSQGGTSEAEAEDTQS